MIDHRENENGPSKLHANPPYHGNHREASTGGPDMPFLMPSLSAIALLVWTHPQIMDVLNPVPDVGGIVGW